MSSLDLSCYTPLSPESDMPAVLRPRHKPGERFLKGPVPWNYLSAACSGRNSYAALRVALVIQLQSGIEDDVATVKPNGKRMRELGLTNSAWRRGFKELERLNLIETTQKPGRLPLVTILDAG